ncbi:hypothetical protein N7516_010953 [Penicillium verrucosum]|uniref:uncharacterized protein n=1 Tax=Penicillium verrucosum TaxID=60171 RepID=UPI0025453859|nr:uncharacterized protein N7516_010953 [Penicillium verrucosum]KAJ5920095.1 hypothetical protein N7516_010953 [Penicillium verrucosum]
MPRIKNLSSRDVLRAPFPSLLVGSFHTTSSALHQIRFTGRLRRWTNFAHNAIAHMSSNIRWSRLTLDVAMTGPGVELSVSREQLVVGDENGVQGRLNERLCRPVTSCLQVQGHNLRCGDFKAGNSAAQAARVPDTVMLNANAAIKVVGEVKTPWARTHVKMLSRGVEMFEEGNEGRLRHILGQVSRYMQDQGVCYAFLSTYNETMFLRKYSPVAIYDDEYDTGSGKITTRQGLFYLALRAEFGPAFATNVPGNQQWTS